MFIFNSLMTLLLVIHWPHQNIFYWQKKRENWYIWNIISIVNKDIFEDSLLRDNDFFKSIVGKIKDSSLTFHIELEISKLNCQVMQTGLVNYVLQDHICKKSLFNIIFQEKEYNIYDKDNK